MLVNKLELRQKTYLIGADSLE